MKSLAEMSVEDAPAEKVWSAVHVLATDTDAPEPDPIHVPAIAKQPVLLTRKSVVVAAPVELAISKRLRLVSPIPAKMLSLALGVEVPIPTLPAPVIVIRGRSLVWK